MVSQQLEAHRYQAVYNFSLRLSGTGDQWTQPEYSLVLPTPKTDAEGSFGDLSNLFLDTLRTCRCKRTF